MRSILLIFLTLFLSMPLVFAGDPMVAKAVARIVKVEAAEASMPAGDQKMATKLISDLNWAQKRLNAVVQNGTPEWKAAKTRLQATRAKVNAKASKVKPTSKPKPAPKPTPGADPNPQPAPTPRYEHVKLVSLNKDISNAWNNLKVVPLRLMKDANRVNGVRREIAGFRKRLAGFPANDSNVQLVTANLNDFEGLLQAGLAKLGGDQDQVAGIEQRIQGMRVKYAKEALPPALEAPFTRGNVEAWARQMRQMRDKDLPADIAWLQGMEGNAALKQNLAGSQRSYLQSSVARRLNEIEKIVRERIAGPVQEQLRNSDWILETNPKDAQHVRSRILGRGALDKHMLRLGQALVAIDLAEVYDSSMQAACVPGPTIIEASAPRRKFPDRDAQRKRIEDSIAHLKVCAVAALDSVRLPAAASSDKALVKIASEVLHLPKNNVMEWERIVISRGKQHHERRRGWVEPGSLNTLDLTIYTYSWDEFVVTTAERRGDEVWLFSNKFENYSAGDARTRVGHWYLARRTELTRILRENLDKPPLPEPRAPQQK